MKHQSPFHRIPWIVLALLPLLGACAAQRGVFHTQTVDIETIRTGPFRVVSASAYEKKGQLVVYGALSRPRKYGGTGAGHVEVSLIDPNGRVLATKKVPYQPAVASGRHTLHARFWARFDTIPPRGLVVRIVPHVRNP